MERLSSTFIDTHASVARRLDLSYNQLRLVGTVVSVTMGCVELHGEGTKVHS